MHVLDHARERETESMQRFITEISLAKGNTKQLIPSWMFCSDCQPACSDEDRITYEHTRLAAVSRFRLRVHTVRVQNTTYIKQSGPRFSQEALRALKKKTPPPSIPPPLLFAVSTSFTRMLALFQGACPYARGKTQWNPRKPRTFNSNQILPPFSVNATFRFPAYKNYFWVPWRYIFLFFIVKVVLFLVVFWLGSNFILVDL